MIVATMNGISAPNFTMNATKFHITMPRKLASATLHSVALQAMQYFSCASAQLSNTPQLTHNLRDIVFLTKQTAREGFIAEMCLMDPEVHTHRVRT